MKRINWYGFMLMVFGILISIANENWFGGCLFGMGLVFMLDSESNEEMKA